MLNLRKEVNSSYEMVFYCVLHDENVKPMVAILKMYVQKPYVLPMMLAARPTPPQRMIQEAHGLKHTRAAETRIGVRIVSIIATV
jgi:hypothetical protein